MKTPTIKKSYPTINITSKLQNWPALTNSEFVKELTKQKLKITLTEQLRWLNHFQQEQTKANAIQSIINQTDKEIDAMVYELYGLTEEEIKIVEGTT